jgi:glycosyltransferase involved in cell wall biosynthesis
MKVLVVSTNVLPSPPPYYGGAELVAFTDALRLAQDGHEVYLLATKLSRASALANYPYLKEYIDAINFMEFGDPIPWGAPISEEEMFNRMLAKKRTLDFDVVIDHSRSRVASMRLAQPALSIVHDLNPPVPLMPVSKQLCYAGVSRFHMNYLRVLFPHLENVITYVYDRIVEEPYLRVKVRGRSDRERAIAFVARIDVGKGILQFIQACKRMPDVKCYIVGDDMPLINASIGARDSMYAIYQQARKYPNIEWVGLVPHDVKIRIMSRVMATVVLPVPPYAEVFGIWALESFLVGTPVITTPNGAMPEYVVNGFNGYIITMSDIQDAVYAIASAGVPVNKTPEEIRQDALNKLNSRDLAKSALNLALKGCGGA